MEDSLVEQISMAHKKNMILWGAILAGMLILFTITYYINTQGIFTPVAETREIGQILFIVAVVLALVILVLKRSVLTPEKIADRIPGTLSKPERDAAALNRIGTNYVIVWALSEAIMVTGFINYVLLTNFNDFLIFSIVALYSLVINIPREGALHRSISILDQQGG
jgi:hypothetical protein